MAGSSRRRLTAKILRRQTGSRRPRRVRVERGIYRNPSTGGLEIEYTDSHGRIRWKMIDGTCRASHSSATVAKRIAYGSRVLRQGRSRPCSANQASSRSSTA